MTLLSRTRDSDKGANTLHGTVKQLLGRSNRTWDEETRGNGRCLPDAVARETRRLAKQGIDMRDTPVTDVAWRQWYVHFVRTHAGTLYGRGCVVRDANNSLITEHLRTETKTAKDKCSCGIWIEPRNHNPMDPLPDVQQFLVDVAKHDHWMNSAFLSAVAWKFQTVGVKLYNLVVPAGPNISTPPDPNNTQVFWQLVQPCVTDKPELIRNSMHSIHPTIPVEAEQIETNAACVGQSWPCVHWQACLPHEEVGSATGAAIRRPGSINAGTVSSAGGVTPALQPAGGVLTSPLEGICPLDVVVDRVDAPTHGLAEDSQYREIITQHRTLLKELQWWRSEFKGFVSKGNHMLHPPLLPPDLFTQACEMRFLWDANTLAFALNDMPLTYFNSLPPSHSALLPYPCVMHLLWHAHTFRVAQNDVSFTYRDSLDV